MTPMNRVRRARTVLLTTVAGSAALWAVALTAGTILLAAVLDLLVPLPVGFRRMVVPAAVAAGVLAAVTVAWRGRHARTLGRVALYLEERLPELHFALATAVQPAGVPSAAGSTALAQAIARVDARGALRPPVTRALAIPAAGLLLGLAALAIVPDGTLERILSPRAGDVLLRNTSTSSAPLGNRLTSVAVSVQPPRYARRAARVVEDPASVAALVGSRIEVRGRGAAAGLTDSLTATLAAASGGEGTPVSLRAVGDTWGFPVTMPTDPAILRLLDRSYDRLLVLQPVPDEPPTVVLTSPRADTMYMTGKGKLQLDARMDDDIGLARAEFEVLYTSGSGERFDTRQTIIGRTALGGNRSARLRATVVLDTMNLRPGDVLHVRALAWDENDVTGPGKGESETRTIRIHDPRQMQDVNITAAKAAAIDTSIMSQRMLIVRAETLLINRPRLEPQDYTTQSLRLGIQQGALRGRVESIIFEMENVEGVGYVGSTPSSLILREAGEEMRIAERELSIAQVPVALVHMRAALKLLEKIRDANRYWLRGLLTTTPIDVDRVRLTGEDRASVSDRDARKREADARQALLVRLDRAVRLLEREPATTVRDSLQLIFAASLTHARDVAEPLSKAVEALQRGADARTELISARRRLERRVESEGALSSWSGTP